LVSGDDLGQISERGLPHGAFGVHGRERFMLAIARQAATLILSGETNQG
jgi:hypothetical protein